MIQAVGGGRAAEEVNTHRNPKDVGWILFHELQFLIFFVLLQGGNIMLSGVAVQMRN